MSYRERGVAMTDKTLASELYDMARSERNEINHSGIQRIIAAVIQEAKRAAIKGEFKVDIWDDALKYNPEVSSPVLEELKRHGFRATVSSNKPTISWKL